MKKLIVILLFSVLSVLVHGQNNSPLNYVYIPFDMSTQPFHIGKGRNPTGQARCEMSRNLQAIRQGRLTDEKIRIFSQRNQVFGVIGIARIDDRASIWIGYPIGNAFFSMLYGYGLHAKIIELPGIYCARVEFEYAQHPGR